LAVSALAAMVLQLEAWTASREPAAWVRRRQAAPEPQAQ